MENKFTEALEFLKLQLTQNPSGMAYCRFKIYEAHIYSFTGDLVECLKSAKVARKEAKRIEHPLFEVKALIEMIYAKWMLGSLKEGYNLIIEAEDLLENLPDTEELKVTYADLYNTKGIITDNLGNIQESLENFEKSLEIRKELGHTEDIAVSLNNIAIIYQNTGKMDKALEYLEESLAIKKETGNQLDIANATSNLAIYYRRKGEFQRALDLLNECIIIFRKFGNVSDMSNLLLNRMLFSKPINRNDILETSYNEFKELLQNNADRINPSIQLNFDVASGIWMLYKEEVELACEIFQQIVDSEIIDHTLVILSIQNLIEIKIKILQNSEDDQNLQVEILDHINLLSQISQKELLFPLHVATIIFKSKFATIDKHYEEARSLLYQALRIAEKHEFDELKLQVLDEIDIIDNLMSIEGEDQEIDISLDNYINLIKKLNHDS